MTAQIRESHADRQQSPRRSWIISMCAVGAAKRGMTLPLLVVTLAPHSQSMGSVPHAITIECVQSEKTRGLPYHVASSARTSKDFNTASPQLLGRGHYCADFNSRVFSLPAVPLMASYLWAD